MRGAIVGPGLRNVPLGQILTPIEARVDESVCDEGRFVRLELLEQSRSAERRAVGSAEPQPVGDGPVRTRTSTVSLSLTPVPSCTDFTFVIRAAPEKDRSENIGTSLKIGT